MSDRKFNSDNKNKILFNLLVDEKNSYKTMGVINMEMIWLSVNKLLVESEHMGCLVWREHPLIIGREC